MGSDCSLTEAVVGSMILVRGSSAGYSSAVARAANPKWFKVRTTGAETRDRSFLFRALPGRRQARPGRQVKSTSATCRTTVELPTYLPSDLDRLELQTVLPTKRTFFATTTVAESPPSLHPRIIIVTSQLHLSLSFSLSPHHCSAASTPSTTGAMPGRAGSEAPSVSLSCRQMSSIIAHKEWAGDAD
jgi:hypothetical protein